ncbi:DNA glycosylase [Corynascus novoguineensis]|uniref:DNA glycosylase n=1 Tax=Corynascus novoguineensis TaxID=1126955 RepID=A0AAN7CW83_9PEZI|nr:DNA glycosylase [Corynascus novoguineensis]
MASDAITANPTASAPPPSTATKKRKVITQAPAAAEKPGGPPSTPRKRRARGADDVPQTPTPAAVSLIVEGSHTQRPKPAAVARLADPNRTNALLRSPKTSRIIAPTTVDAVPSKLRDSIKPAGPEAAAAATATKPTTTTTLLEEACAHLIKVDPRMKPLIDKHHCRIFSPEGLAEQIDPFESLCSSIISQQVSGAAAKSIKARFIALFNDSSNNSDNNHAPITGGEDAEGSVAPDATTAGAAAAPFPSPTQVAAARLEALRTAGLSQRKAEYIQGLAELFARGELTAQMLADAPYEELLTRLTAVRGLGRWTVEMFACFALKRMDVFSTGDLGVQRGMAAFVGRDIARLKAKGGNGKWKYMTEREMEEISDRFRPYRSLFMWYMWRVEETDVSTMEQ